MLSQPQFIFVSVFFCNSNFICIQNCICICICYSPFWRPMEWIEMSAESASDYICISPDCICICSTLYLYVYLLFTFLTTNGVNGGECWISLRLAAVWMSLLLFIRSVSYIHQLLLLFIRSVSYIHQLLPLFIRSVSYIHQRLNILASFLFFRSSFNSSSHSLPRLEGDQMRSNGRAPLPLNGYWGDCDS